MSYYFEKIAEIMQKMQSKKTAPVYEPDKWVVNDKPLFTNCYAYALDLDVSDPETTIFIPGSISNENACKQIYTLDTFVKISSRIWISWVSHIVMIRELFNLENTELVFIPATNFKTFQ